MMKPTKIETRVKLVTLVLSSSNNNIRGRKSLLNIESPRRKRKMRATITSSTIIYLRKRMTTPSSEWHISKTMMSWPTHQA